MQRFNFPSFSVFNDGIGIGRLHFRLKNAYDKWNKLTWCAKGIIMSAGISRIAGYPSSEFGHARPNDPCITFTYNITDYVIEFGNADFETPIGKALISNVTKILAADYSLHITLATDKDLPEHRPTYSFWIPGNAKEWPCYDTIYFAFADTRVDCSNDYCNPLEEHLTNFLSSLRENFNLCANSEASSDHTILIASVSAAAVGIAALSACTFFGLKHIKNRSQEARIPVEFIPSRISL